MSTIAWRLGQVEGEQKELDERVTEHQRDIEAVRERLSKQEEQVLGQGGLWRAVEILRQELIGVRKAFYSLTGAIVVATVTLAAAIVSHAL